MYFGTIWQHVLDWRKAFQPSKFQCFRYCLQALCSGPLSSRAKTSCEVGGRSDQSSGERARNPLGGGAWGGDERINEANDAGLTGRVEEGYLSGREEDLGGDSSEIVESGDSDGDRREDSDGDRSEDSDGDQIEPSGGGASSDQPSDS